jgi:signal transduction histidine kinase
MTLLERPGRIMGGLALPRTTVRWRLTMLYGGLILLSGAALLVIAYTLMANDGVHIPIATSLRGPLQNVAIKSGIALAILAIASMLLGWWVAGRALRPLRAITSTTQRISDTNLNERLAIGGPRDELTQLADTIDGLLERLEAAFESQRRFVTNASHELRTPLTTMRAMLDVASAKSDAPAQLRALDTNLRDQLDHADRLLESFLTLARAQRGELGPRASVSLSKIADDALTARGEEIAARQLRVQSALAPIRVTGSETLLTRMIENVIENAVRHNEAHGLISIALERAGETARLTVESGGPVLDPDAVAQLANPFRRLASERTGSQNGHGLGLSIVAAVAAAHGGAIGIHARAQGGLRVQITLTADSAVDPALVSA